MPRRLPDSFIFALAGLLVALPAPATAQRHGGGGGWHGGGGGWHGGSGRWHRGSGGWYGGGGYAGYGGYYGYRPYYGNYYGYPGYHGGYHDGWIAVGAGVLGVLIGSAIARPAYAYPYPVYAPPPVPPPAPVPAPVQPAPPGPQCAAGSVMSPDGYCQSAPQPTPERG